MFGIRWAVALASLQAGAIHEAEHWLALAALNRADDAVELLTFELGLRAEILLARGEVEAGLRLWRRAADRAEEHRERGLSHRASGLDAGTLEIQAVAVIAHARHGCSTSLRRSPPNCRASCRRCSRTPSSIRRYLADFPVCGALLLAVAMADLDRESAPVMSAP